MIEDGFSVLDGDFSKLAQPKEVSKVEKVAIERILPNPYQPRKTFEEGALNDLTASVAMYGILQPLLVAPAQDGCYTLIAGERRLRAAKLADLKEVPIIVSQYDEQQKAEISLIENLQREDLHFLEEAEGYEQLMERFHLTQEAMAARVGKKQSTIANKVRLLKLSAAVRQKILEYDLSERHARALLSLEKDEDRLQVLQVVRARKYSVRQTEAYIDKLLKSNIQKKKRRPVIVNDVRVYVNSVKRIAAAVKEAGIPVNLEQNIEGEEVVVTLRIKNMKRPKDAHSTPLFK